MICNKQQLVCGMQEFINDDIIPGIQDKPLKMALYAAMMLPGIYDSILEKPAVKAFLHESDGFYNLDEVQNALTATMDKFGSFPVTVNPVPFIIPSAIQISLTRTDLDSLTRHIERMINNG